MNASPLTFIPRQTPRHRRRQAAPAAAATVGPVLVSATFDGAEPYVLTLAFDRAINPDAFVPADVVVYDGPSVTEFRGTASFELPTPETLTVTMQENGEFTGAGVSLTASGGAGIVAAAPPVGEPWAGVTGIELPFP